MLSRVCLWAGVLIAGLIIWGCSEDKTTESAPDTTPPRVTTTFPADGDTGVAVDIHLQVGFSEDMTTSMLTSQTIYIVGLSGDSVLASSRSATLIPAQDLEYYHEYTATVTTNVRDAAGNRLAQNYVWHFTTGSDTTRPIVFLTDPADGAVNVPTYAIIRVLMSKPIDSASVTTSTFYLSDGVMGAVETRKDTLLFIQEDTLMSNHTYTATLTTGITDTLGNALAADYSWSFTTIAAPIIMPLAIGNSWEYYVTTIDTLGHTTSGYSTITLVSTTTIGDEIWFLDNLGRKYTDRDDGLWEIKTDSLYRAAASPGRLGDSATYVVTYQRAHLTLVAVDTLITVPAGDFVCDKYEGILYDAIMPRRFRIYYADGIGMVQYENAAEYIMDGRTEKLSSYSFVQ